MAAKQLTSEMNTVLGIFSKQTLSIINFYHSTIKTAVETNSCRHATKKNNLEKNQNQKTIPYDFSRVVLDKIEGIPDSDYINASMVDVSGVHQNIFRKILSHSCELRLNSTNPDYTDHVLEHFILVYSESSQAERLHC